MTGDRGFGAATAAYRCRVMVAAARRFVKDAALGSAAALSRAGRRTSPGTLRNIRARVTPRGRNIATPARRTACAWRVNNAR
ncbi:hypothetical protein DB771_12620 [Burkholderia sp. AU29985]|nr:hypothetical protein XM57_21505 [Burkholderia cepacia]AYZ94422.1 hypothetical protein EGY28_04735 [Burkholderia dolosa]ETP63854.1 hypothetical protein BDSB_25350 [Burkholderia dolosa PC543]PRE47292.1 hypothetical protein C6P87_18570 [Burkholderia sp. AU12872]PUA76654.1 hypothetical protein DB771_12620 [Burkholderia sp. AU29985]